jgi:diguanylate cyclase (GGDEF)-like protein/PAS domain S-box-containing protein
LTTPLIVPTLRDRIARWNATASTTLRVAALALLSLVLGYVGAWSVALPPWGALALPAALALVARWRWGRAAMLGVCLGLFGACAGLTLPLGTAMMVAFSGAVGAASGRALLSYLRADCRLERGPDVVALILAVGASALSMALPLTAWLAATSGIDAWTVLTTGWWTLLLGMLPAVVTLLAIESSLVHALQRGVAVPRLIGGMAALTLMLVVQSLVPATGPMGSAVRVLGPTVVLVGLVLGGQLALSAGGLLLFALLEAGRRTAGWDATGSGAAPLSSLGVWVAAALAMVLMAHATVSDWRGRSQRWEWALDGSRLGVADWHLQREDSFASSAWRALTGHARPVWSPAAWMAQVHPEDRALLAGSLEALKSGDSGRSRIELRVPQAEGWRWTEATLMVIERDASGDPVRLLATLADVQERHESQERQLMSASLFQHLHEGLLVTDADLRVLDLNPAYSAILGMGRDEVLGTVPSLLQPSPGDPVERQQRAAMWASLRDTGTWRGELLERRRSGELCTLKTTISTVRGTDNALRYHVLVISDVTEQQAQRDRLERQEHFDELTRLPNRARLSQLMDDAMAAAERDGYLLVVCYLDLDRFKPVNDRYGHAAGDRLLAELAGRLRSALRSRERWTDSAARLGGDEFVLLLRAGTLEEARMAVERVLRVVSQPYLIDPAQEPALVTASMGATVYPVDRSDADTLLRHADHAMYGAKQAGRNGYLFFDPEHRRRTEQRVTAIGRIQEALDRQEFVLYYQPKVDMRSGRVLGFEALLRWEHPQQGLVAPMQFLPLIENTGLSSRVGDWVLSQALEHLSQWRRDGLDFSVSVNVSARHLQEPDFALRLSELLARHTQPLAPHLELEMLETAAHADIVATSTLVAHCQSLGVRFALDDFGTGYSTLTYLKRLPVDVLKIDRSFVHHMLDDDQDRAIVEGVIGLAKTFGCTVVAEGVESPAQARTLLDLGCDIGQGTGIAAPMPAAQVAGWVHDYRGMFALVPAAPPGSDPGARLAG